MLDKMKETLDKGVTAVGAKSSEFIEINKLKAQIRGIEAEIQIRRQELSAVAYKCWKSGAIELSSIEDVCKEIEVNEQKISQLESDIENFQEISKRARGDLTDKDVCKCGQKNPSDSKFCRGCGEKINIPAPVAGPGSKTCACGNVVGATTNFCTGCGAKV